jgi:hypothetical protein
VSDTLVRYGLHWRGPQEFVCKPMSDGLWTPWQEAHHALTAARELANKAQAELAEARRELEIARKASAALYGGPPLEEVIRDAERYRWLREAQNDDIGVVQGFGAVDVGSTGVADTYERVLYRANLDAAIDAARKETP